MPTTVEMQSTVNALIVSADLALLQGHCDDADSARKRLQQYYNEHYRQMPPKLMARAADAIVRIVPRVDRCKESKPPTATALASVPLPKASKAAVTAKPAATKSVMKADKPVAGRLTAKSKL